MIRISQQLVPGCLNGRGYCQVYLQSMLRWCSVCCHFPSDNPSVLTGAGSKAIPRAIRGESIICVHCLCGIYQVWGKHWGEGGCRNVNQRSQTKQMHSPLFRLKFLREWLLSLGRGSSSQHAASSSLYQICHIDPLSLPINILHVAIIVRGI